MFYVLSVLDNTDVFFLQIIKNHNVWKLLAASNLLWYGLLAQETKFVMQDILRINPITPLTKSLHHYSRLVLWTYHVVQVGGESEGQQQTGEVVETAFQQLLDSLGVKLGVDPGTTNVYNLTWVKLGMFIC